MSYRNFDETFTRGMSIVIEGWPSHMPKTNPSNLNREFTKLLINLLKATPPKLYFRKLSKTEFAEWEVNHPKDDGDGDGSSDSSSSSEDRQFSSRRVKKAYQLATECCFIY